MQSGPHFVSRTLKSAPGDETIIMDQSFGAFLLRVRSINLHATLIARHPLFFLSPNVIGGNFAAGLNSGILDTKQTGSLPFRPPPFNGWVRLRKLNVIQFRTRQRREQEGLSYLWRENERGGTQFILAAIIVWLRCLTLNFDANKVNGNERLKQNYRVVLE